MYYKIEIFSSRNYTFYIITYFKKKIITFLKYFIVYLYFFLDLWYNEVNSAFVGINYIANCYIARFFVEKY